MKTLACITALLLVGGASASAAGLKNDGFETGDFTAWQIGGEGWRASSYGRDSRRGTYGAVNDVWTNGADEFRIVNQEIKVKPSQTYQAGVWLRTVCIEDTESFLEIQFLDKYGKVLTQFQSTHVKKDQDFTFMSIDKMAAPDETAIASIRGVVHIVTQPINSTDYHVFDDFEFRRADDAPPAINK
jgi:hypothetical protein